MALGDDLKPFDTRASGDPQIQRDGIETGNLLRIKHVGSVIRDIEEEDPDFRVKLPDEEVGIVMVVRTFEKMSYGLVMEASRPVSIKDYVESP